MLGAREMHKDDSADLPDLQPLALQRYLDSDVVDGEVHLGETRPVSMPTLGAEGDPIPCDRQGSDSGVQIDVKGHE